jgi:large subunit ribosomal protein L5
MYVTDYYYDYVFARDMLLKMDSHTLFDTVQFDKMTVQYTSKYVLAEKKNILPAVLALELFTGQKPRLTRAKKSVAAFKLKEDTLLGCTVTLRQQPMRTFLGRFVHVLLPRFKRFEAVVPSHTQNHVHLGVKQLLFFPALEKNVEMFEFLPGCSVHVHTTARTHAEKLLLCSAFKLPVLFLKA